VVENVIGAELKMADVGCRAADDQRQPGDVTKLDGTNQRQSSQVLLKEAEGVAKAYAHWPSVSGG
jgi:hypothetical protein